LIAVIKEEAAIEITVKNSEETAEATLVV